MTNAKTVLFYPSSYLARGWGSVFIAILLLMCYIFNFSSTTKLFLTLITFFWGGELFIRGAILQLLRCYIGFNAFVVVSALAALLFSALNVLREGISVPVQGFSAVMPFIFAVSNFIKYFEIKHIGQSRKFIESLDGFIAKSVLKICADGKIRKMFVSEVELGDSLIIKHGERIAVDCRITKGKTFVDESLLTGNITLAAKQAGGLLLAGSINKGEEVQAEAVSLKNTSKIAGVLEEVKKSETKKILLPSMLEIYAYKVLIFFFIIACLQLIGSMLWQPENIFYWFLVFLFILALSGPVTYMAAVLLPVYFTKKNAQKYGIFIQNDNALNLLNESTKIFIDKTGTLTAGRLEVAEIEPAEKIKEEDLIKAAYAAQYSAENIFSVALKEYARKNKLPVPKITSMEFAPNFGTVVKEGRNTIMTGRKSWLEQNAVEGLPSAEDTQRTVFYVAKNGKYIGAVYFKDRLRANVKDTIAFIKQKGKKICLISGDNRGAVGAAANMAGIEEYYGDMFPQDKAARICAAANMNEKTVMLGDGFNDILALLQAGAGIAFNAANNVFVSWVDIIIKDRDFAAFKRVFGFQASRARIIKQNVCISVLAGVLSYWYIIGACQSARWYDLFLIIFITVIIMIFNSKRINYE